MKNKISIISLSLTIATIVCVAYLFFSRPKIAYVHNDRILTEYLGVKEGKRIYNQKLKEAKANLDTLAKEVNKETQKYKLEYKSLSLKEKKLSEDMLKRKQEDYFNYKKAMEDRIKEEDNKLSASVINQINSYIIDYGKKHGYDYVFGVGSEGNIFYAKESGDITDEILKGLNSKYKGE